ncbi:multidrug efflux system [Burkholderiales bacterium 8X]|nr:multidrug efflux system [Burkholderiales bacterium 8X]
MRSFPILGACALCVLLVLPACKDKTRQAAPPPVPEVVVGTIESKPVPLKTDLSGRTAAFMVAEVRPQVGGIIRNRPFTEGSPVKAGQVLYEIDPEPFQAAVQQQEGSLANARATVESTRALSERYKALLPMNGVSKQEYDNALAAYRQAQAGVQVQTAALNTARINLQNTKVKAPISGRTSRSAVTPGALVSANQAAALLTISQLDPIYVDIVQSSSELVRLREALRGGTLAREATQKGQPAGQRVTLMMENGNPYPHEGRIQLTEVTVDPSSSSVTLRAVFPNPDGVLLPGMYVRTVVTEGVTSNGILVPQQAIARDRKGNPTARVVGAGDKIEVRQLVVARSIGTDWLVTEGLKAGDRLVLEGARDAQPGTQVKVVSGAAGSPPAPGAGSNAAPPAGNAGGSSQVGATQSAARRAP